MEKPTEKKPRRQRYSGRNPKGFAEKYKEHQPERYREDVAKIIENGKTPAGMHRPIMVAEILEFLELKPGDDVVDCTLGYGGHATELSKGVQPGGRLLGVDSDPIEFPKVELRLRSMGLPESALVLRRLNFAGLAGFLSVEAPNGVNAFLADLGASSMQLDDPRRGFSFKLDGPLDMRMNPSRGLSASQLLSTLSVAQLSQLLAENSDEPKADRIAQSIVASCREKAIETTIELAKIVRNRVSELGKEEIDLTVRRVFQSLRIAVNDEFRSLDTFLKQLPSFLKSGGRVAILSFHSGEDRRVKAAFKMGLQEGSYRWISSDFVRPTFEEQRSNTRSSSAKLRFAIRS